MGNNRGYLLLPRSICDQPWYRRPTCRLLAYHLLQEASYKATEHPVLGDLPAGSYVTSTRGLAEELGVSHQEIRTALLALVESEFLTVESFGVGRYGGLKIVIIWADFTSLRDGDIMLNNTLNNTLSNTLNNTLSNSATDEYSASYKGVEVEPNTLTNTLSNTLTNTANINKDKLNITNTHTKSIYNLGSNKNAHTREAHTHDAPMSAEAQALSEWIAKNYPELDQMERPLRPEQREHLVQFYGIEKIRQIIADFVSKGGPRKHLSAFSGIMCFLRNEFTPRAERLYTYDEMLSQMSRYGIKQDAFKLVEVAGRKGWQRVS